MKRLTIKEVAKIAGVSPTAVSFVLNGKPGVSEETRKHVQSIIDNVQFTPTKASRRLVLQCTYNIVLLFNSRFSPLVDMFYWILTRSIMECCNEYGYNLVLTEVLQEDGTNRIPDVIRERDVDGIICLHYLSDNIRQAIRSEGIPYIVVDTNDTHHGDVLLYIDYANSVETAIGYLMQRGLRHIGLIHSEYAENFYHTVLDAYENSLSVRQLPLDRRIVQTNADSVDSASECMQRILDSGAEVDAVLCSDIPFAVGAMKRARHAKLRVPEDISFICIDDNHLAAYTEPELTTIPNDLVHMGHRAVEMIMDMIKRKEVASQVVKPGKIIVRQSVR